MKNPYKSGINKALYFASLYYFIVAIISLSIPLYFFILNLFTSAPLDDTKDYLFQLLMFAFLFLLIICNYQILFYKLQKNSIIVNMVFSFLQIFSFHFSYIQFLFSFGTAFGLVIGDHYGIQFQMLFKFFNNTATLKIVNTPGFPYISINLVPLIIFFIMLASLKRMKKIQTNDKQI